MSARRKKQRRIRDLRTIASVGFLTRAEADAIGAAHGLGPVSLPKPTRRLAAGPGMEHPYRPSRWAAARADEARAAR